MNKFNIEKKICFFEPLKLNVGDTFLHPVTKLPFKVIDFPYNSLPTILNLETNEIGVITQKRTGNFRPSVDVYKDQTVQVCEVRESTADEELAAEVAELKGRLVAAQESDTVSQMEITELRDLAERRAVSLATMEEEMKILKRKLSEKDNELSVNGKSAREIVELAKAICGMKE